MTAVTSTPPALRWVALFLAACAVLGLFLGFRDQIRKNPPDWYTGAESAAPLLPATPDTAREAVAFDPTPPPAPTEAAPRPAPKVVALTPETADAADTAEAESASPPARPIPPPVLTPAPAPKLKAATPAPKSPPSADPVGDILEGQKQAETPAAVPY